jgi:alkaline phosphatase
MKNIILFLTLTAFSVNLWGSDKPKNIILFIGDGMGPAQVSAHILTKGKTSFDHFDHAGLVTNHASDNLITDSGAAGTALATGRKSYNGAVSISPDGDTLKTVFEYAREQGMSTGIVVTCTVTHATPACFVAHTESREDHNEIARQIAEFAPEVLIGGGLMYFLPGYAEGSARQDSIDLIEKLSAKTQISYSYNILKHRDELSGLTALLAMEDLQPAPLREYTLGDMTRKALDALSKNENGFILMVEGSQIDWACHDNMYELFLDEMNDFDSAIAEGLKFAEDNPETLILVTADHETGGMTLDKGGPDNRLTGASFSTGEHTAALIPVFAKGPSSANFSGILDNTDIGKWLIELIRNREPVE